LFICAFHCCVYHMCMYKLMHLLYIVGVRILLMCVCIRYTLHPRPPLHPPNIPSVIGETAWSGLKRLKLCSGSKEGTHS
jgi:hypothetical protein